MEAPASVSFLEFQPDDGVRRPRGSSRGGEMKLNFAAGGCCECGRGQAGDLAQEFFEGFFLFRVVQSNLFGSRLFRRRRLRARFRRGTSAPDGPGDGRQTQGHLAMDSASGDDRVPDIGIGKRASGSKEISNMVGCPATWENTLWRQVFQDSHQLRSSGRSSRRGSGRTSGDRVLARKVSGTSVIFHPMFR